MFAKLTDCKKKDVIIVRVDGCATMVGFREAVASILKVTNVTDVDESSADSVVRHIKHEARSIKCNSANYDLSEFTQENTVKSTAIRIGKGGLKGMTLSPEMVTKWIDYFPITAHIADIMDHIYPGTSVDDSSGDGVGERNSHNEEGKKRIALDSDDRNRISQELYRLSHPLEDKSPHLYNIVNGAFAPPLSWGECYGSCCYW